MRNFLFTSESVTEGHPDKVCDQIADAVLDAILKDDPKGRVACEALITNGVCLIAGEITTSTYVEISDIARQVIKDIGYTDAEYGFHWQTSGIATAIQKQSPDISQAVDPGDPDGLTTGAGDQGLMFGYATNETPEYMPIPIVLAHKLALQLAQVRKHGEVKGLRPDGKTQVTVEYEDSMPKRVDTVVVSTQHDEEVFLESLRSEIIDKVIKPVIPTGMFDEKTIVHVNPSGRFVMGGPQADTGLTGRKIIVDTYGGFGRHGGGAISGKDVTKVDRSGVYAVRWVAKNLVAAGLAERVEVQVSYAIGKAEPISISVDSFGTGKKPDHEIAEIVKKAFDLRPGAIIKDLNLRRPIYRGVASYGHFGRLDLDLPWEQLNKVDELKKYI
ncbi:MAG TPA: methionine adenosyltransferase [Patescibacteria group bacterium]|nr:methionine adenosyltransferase [Patescibacteria group bacterium]